MEENLDSLMEEIEELPTFESPIGFMEYGRVQYKIFRSLENPAASGVNEETPATYGVTLDTGGGESLSVWVWEGVPADFRDTLFYHELKEAEFRFADGLSEDESHKRAVQLHMAYAKKFLPKDKFQRFLEWQSQYDAYNAERFFER